MNNQLHDLSESLNRRASQVSPEALPDLGVIRRRAGQIRRRRIAVGTGAALGLAAVAAPLAWQLGGPQKSAPLPPAERPVATDTAVPTPIKSGARTGMDLRNLPAGDAVGIGWASLDGTSTTLHPASGTPFRVDLPEGGFLRGFATLEDGRTVGATEKQVLVWDHEGTVVFDEATSTGTVAVDRTHRNVAWVDSTGRARVLVSETDQPQTLPSGNTTLREAVAIDSSAGDCTPTQDAQQGCVVAFNTTASGPVVVSAAGTVASPYGSEVGGTNLADISDLWRPPTGISGTLAGRDQASGCGELVTLNSEPGEPNCERQYGTVSPDGTQVTLVDDAPRKGADPEGSADRIGVFTLHQQTPTWFRTPDAAGSNAAVIRSAWVGDTELVSLVWQDGDWSLVRFDKAGKASRVSQTVARGAEEPAFALEIQP